MKFTIEIQDTDARALDVLAALANVLGAATIVARRATTASAPRQRKSTADAAAVTMQAAIDAGLMPAQTTAQPEPQPEAATDSGVAEIKAGVDAALSLDDLHKSIKDNLHKMGAAWARNVISGEHKCNRVGDLSADAAASVWAAMQASGNV
jgi:hypothetical protein